HSARCGRGAARRVRPGTHYGAAPAEALQRRVPEGFGRGRDAMEQWKLLNPGRSSRLSERKLDPETSRFLLAQRDEFWKALQAVVDDEDYLVLARTGFDPAVERIAARLAGLAGPGLVGAARGRRAALRARRTVPSSAG